MKLIRPSLIKPTRRAFIAAAPAIIMAPSLAEAWWQSIQQVGVSGAVAGSVWGSKGTVMTLSTTTIANDTVTNSTGASWGTVRGTQGYAIGSANKVCFDLIFTAGSTSSLLVGLEDATAASGSAMNNFLGSFFDGVGNLESGGQGFSASSGGNYVANNASGGWGPLVTNDAMRIALDCANKFGYVAKNGTYLTFGGNVGNPTSGVSGTGAAFSWSSGTPTVFPACSLQITTDGFVTIKTTGLAGLPSGYSNWG